MGVNLGGRSYGQQLQDLITAEVQAGGEKNAVQRAIEAATKPRPNVGGPGWTEPEPDMPKG